MLFDDFSVVVSHRTENRSSDRRYTDRVRYNDDMAPPGDVAIDDAMMTAVRSKLERIQQLRQQYQQTHRERQGRYLHDDQEDLYEQQLRRYEQVSGC